MKTRVLSLFVVVIDFDKLSFVLMLYSSHYAMYSILK